MERVQIKRHGHVAEVILSRSDKMNAIDIPMFEALIKAGNEVNKDASVRCVILRGEGRSFCAGLDLSNFTPDPNAEMNQSLMPRPYGESNKWQEAVWVWRKCAVPVIAAVHGIAYGGGLQIMSGADIKIVHPETKLSIMEGKWGIIPDMSGTQLWRHNVRQDILMELTYTHRIFSGIEAVEYGFATHTSETPRDDAMKLAHEIASKSPSFIVQSKKLLTSAPYMNTAEGLLMESQLQEDIIRKENQMEAVFAGMQKREGKFKDFR